MCRGGEPRWVDLDRGMTEKIECAYKDMSDSNPEQVLDFGCARDAFPKEKLGQRIIVNELGQEISDPLEIALEGNAPVE